MRVKFPFDENLFQIAINKFPISFLVVYYEPHPILFLPRFISRTLTRIQKSTVFLVNAPALKFHYRPPEGGRLYDMKVVSGYAFLRTYFV